MKKLWAKSLLLSTITGTLMAITACEAPKEESRLQQANTIVCTKKYLPTLKPFHLIVSTSKPTYAPWVINDDPTNQKGFEPAVIYAISEQLGYLPNDIEWTRGSFVSLFSPGKKNFDMAINQITINDDRKHQMDFSSPYYKSVEVVIVKKNSKFSRAHSLEELFDAKIGAMSQSTAVSVLNHSFHTAAGPQVFETNLDSILAFNNGQIDAILTDTPTAKHMIKYQINDGQILGAVPRSVSPPENFGIVLDKGSNITPCTVWAVNRLRKSGKLTDLIRQWIGDQTVKILTKKK